jgi:hypothetical protein
MPVLADPREAQQLIQLTVALTRARSQPPAPDAAAWRDDPLLFASAILGQDHWSIPQDILRTLAEPRARVAVKAAHASSKTFTAAAAVAWWTARGGLALTTAPTWTQVEDVLWPGSIAP